MGWLIHPIFIVAKLDAMQLMNMAGVPFNWQRPARWRSLRELDRKQYRIFLHHRKWSLPVDELFCPIFQRHCHRRLVGKRFLAGHTALGKAFRERPSSHIAQGAVQLSLKFRRTDAFYRFLSSKFRIILSSSAISGSILYALRIVGA